MQIQFNNTYRYILRYLICPTHHSGDRIEELAEFCCQARVEEVMLLFTAEELTDGHPTIEELGPWIEVAKKAKARLAQDGVIVSLNPWTTTFHVARGRRLKPGQDFRLMVGETGSEAHITACPLCEKWQKYICETFAYMCREIKPTALWVEDDWRLHNHEPEMKYGGCFCDLHLSRFAKMIGRESVTREALLENILAPGQPHTWRSVWMELCRDTLLEPAVKLRNAVQKASPSTRLALMSSNPDKHSIEGRDWDKMQDAWGLEPEFLTRPNLHPYTEVTALRTFPSVTRQTLANLRRPIKVYPELENSPRCGIYSKSKRYTVMECLESVCYGADGITINHFDMMGNGTNLDPEFATALAKPKAVLNAVASLDLDDESARGAAVLFSPQVAMKRHCNQGQPKEINNLLNGSTHWANTLSILGISYGFVKKPVENRPIFVNDQTLQAFSDSEIKKLLGGVLVCDAQSVEILINRGFGEFLGVESVQWKTLNELGYGYEEISEGQASVYGVDNPRMTASRCSDKILVMQPQSGASVRTVIRTGSHKEVAPGTVVYKNELSGTIVSTAYPLGQLQFYMGYFNVFRKIFWRELLFELSGQTELSIAENHPFRVYRNKLEGKTFIGLINPTLDQVDKIVLRFGEINASPNAVKILFEDGQWQQADIEIENLEKNLQRWIIKKNVGPLKAVYLLHEE